MKKLSYDILVIGILVVLILPSLIRFADGFFKMMGMEYPDSNIGPFYVMCVCLLSYYAFLSGGRLFWFDKKTAWNMVQSSLTKSLIMTIYLTASCGMFLKLVPVAKFSDINWYIWPLSYGWFLLLSVVPFSVKIFLRRKSACLTHPPDGQSQ